jgi:hypothetical protein
MLEAVEGVLLKEKPDWVLVNGDTNMRMPVLSWISAAWRDRMGWLSKCALTFRRCSTVMGAMVRDNSPSPRMYKRLKGLRRSMFRCLNANSPWH